MLDAKKKNWSRAWQHNTSFLQTRLFELSSLWTKFFLIVRTLQYGMFKPVHCKQIFRVVSLCARCNDLLLSKIRFLISQCSWIIRSRQVIDLVFTFPQGLKDLEWVYNKTTDMCSSFPTTILSTYFFVHSFRIFSFLASGHGATIHLLIFRSVNLVQYFESSGDHKSKLFFSWSICRFHLQDVGLSWTSLSRSIEEKHPSRTLLSAILTLSDNKNLLLRKLPQAFNKSPNQAIVHDAF